MIQFTAPPQFDIPSNTKLAKKVFISGKITDEEETYQEKFKVAKLYLESKGLTVMSPAVLPLGFEHDDYMQICYKMIDACDAVVFLHDWLLSEGAKLEYQYAALHDKKLFLFDQIVRNDAIDQLIDLREEKRHDMKGDLKLGDSESVYIKDFIALDWVMRNFN